MTSAELSAPKLSLMPFEIEVVKCRAPFMFLAAGRGAGKTHAIQARIKYLLTRYPGMRYMYISPIFSQGNDVHRELMACESFREFIDFKQSNRRPYPHTVLKNSSQVWFRSFQRADNIRSSGEDEVCIDESQDPVFTENNVESIVIPLIGRRQSPAGGRGTFFLSGQFRGADWRFEKYWKPGQIPGQDKFKSWRIPSSEGYSYRTPGGAELLAFRKQTTDQRTWEQEWDCIPRSNSRAAFPEDQINAIIRGDPRQFQTNGCICGVDIGKIVDPTAVIVMNAQNEIIVAENFVLGQAHQMSAMRSARIAAQYRALMIVDSTGGAGGGHAPRDQFVVMYRNAADGLKIEFREFFWSHKNKERIINSLGLAIQNGELSIPPVHNELIRQLKAFEYTQSPRTHDYYFGAPKGQHDDLVMALAMAWDATRHRGEKGTLPMSVA